MDLTKLGRTERILGIVGILALVDSFLPWYSVSVSGGTVGGISYGGSASASGWSVGIGGWFPLLLLLAIGVVVVLPAFGTTVPLRGGFATITAASLLATVIILIRWLTYQSADYPGVSAGASFGTYVGLILGIVATVFGYLAFTASGGSLNNIGAAFSGGPGSGGGAGVSPVAPPPQGWDQPQPPEGWQQPPQQ
jgi:hypothetical protein